MIRRLTENWGWKLAALATALVLWVVLIGNQENTTTLSAPVQYRNIPKDSIISSDVVDTVRLQLRGPSAKLNRLSRDSIGVELNLGEGGQTGERSFTIREDTLNLPPGVRLTRAMPSQIRLRLEYRVSREVPVDVRYAGPPPAGYKLSSVGVEPQKVWIVGPETRVRALESVETDAIDLQPLAGRGKSEFRVGIFVDDPHVSLRDSDHVTVTVAVEPDKIKPEGNR